MKPMLLTENMPCFWLKILKLFFSYVFKLHICDILVGNPADKEQLGSDKKVYTWYKTDVELTLILLTWRICWAPSNASNWRMGFDLAFKGLIRIILVLGDMTRSTAANSNVPKEHAFLTLIVLMWRIGWAHNNARK